MRTSDRVQISHMRKDAKCLAKNPWSGNCWWQGNDPVCEANKKRINEDRRVSCEIEKAAANTSRRTAIAACNIQKGVANSAAKFACEAQKTGQNELYRIERDTCVARENIKKAACEVDREANRQICKRTGIFNGDILGPAGTNLFRRALGQNPLLPFLTDFLSTTIAQGGPAGEAEILIGTNVRLSQAKDKDNTGDDLNHIAQLIVAELRWPSDLSRAATMQYKGRPASYGSYLSTYYERYGSDLDNEDVAKARMDEGIASGWKPDVGPIYGAVRWYHRPKGAFGANPLLALIWQPIIEYYFNPLRLVPLY